MKEVCFIIPTHPPRYDYANNLLSSFCEYNLDKQADLYFVFTNKEERKQFGEYKHTITLPENLQPNKVKAIVNVKKIYALYELKDKYEYFIILDDESLFIKDVDIKSLCDEYFESKLVYGNKSNVSGNINIPTFNALKNTVQNTKIKYIIDNLYLRRNNLSILKNSTLDDFFLKINYGELMLKEFDKLAFFEMTYQYYLIYYHGRNVVDLHLCTPNASVVEYSGFMTKSMKRRARDLAKIYDFYWCSQYMLNYFDNPKCFIKFHLDRYDITIKDMILQYIILVFTRLGIYSSIKRKIYKCGILNK